MPNLGQVGYGRVGLGWGRAGGWAGGQVGLGWVGVIWFNPNLTKYLLDLPNTNILKSFYSICKNQMS